MQANGVYRNSPIDIAHERGLVRQARGVLLDWDGCIAIGNRITREARGLIEQTADRLAILSNNSTHLPEDIAGLLAREGITLPAERIILAGTETLRWAAGRPAERTMLFSSARIRAQARIMGIELVREASDRVLLMRDSRFNYSKLERAVNAVRNGAALVAANADRTHPGPNNQIVPETGALLAAVTTCLDRVEITTIGKPGPLMFERACAVLDVAPTDAVMIGDNPETDIAGARAFGIRPILVSGKGGVGLRLRDLTQ